MQTATAIQRPLLHAVWQEQIVVCSEFRKGSEVLLVTNRDLETLRSFNSRGRITVSAYLRLDTPQYRESAHDEFVHLMQEQLERVLADENVSKDVYEIAAKSLK